LNNGRWPILDFSRYQIAVSNSQLSANHLWIHRKRSQIFLRFKCNAQ